MSEGAIIVALDRSCNNRCRFCSQADLARERAVSDVRAQLEQAYAAGCHRVEFVGGEPTIHDELQEAIGLARRIGFDRIGVQTNGRRLAYRSYTELLVTAGLTHVDVSLHGPTAPVHDFHTTVEGSFQQTVAGVRRARAAGLETAITTVVTRSNVQMISALAGVVTALGVKQWRLLLAQHVGRVVEDARRIVPRWAAAARFLADAHRIASAGSCCIVVGGLPPCIAPALPRWVDPDLPVQLSVRCRACAARASCPGVDPGYLAMYGDGELQPFSMETARHRADAKPTSCVGRVGRPPLT